MPLLKIIVRGHFSILKWIQINEDNCKNSSQVFSFEIKEASASYCPSITKESWSSLEFAKIWHANWWNCFWSPQQATVLNCSRDFGGSNCGLLHKIVASFISIQWTSVFGICWKLRPVAHHTQLWSLWKCLWLKLGPIYCRRSWVQQLRASEDKLSE